MALPTAQTVNIICPEGDLLLRVIRKGSESLLLVSTRVLVDASKSFSSLLQMHCRPITQTFTLTNELKLLDDDGDAMLTICNILHGHDQEVPIALSIDALKNVASSCNRYQLTNALSAWSSKWLDHALSKAGETEVYTVIAIAVDLGYSSTLVKHDAQRSYIYRPLGTVDHNLAG